MSFKCGIVGLPNVGKSTLFNALLSKAAAEAANFPFCTIEPNVGRVGVPDPRLDKIAKIANSANILPTMLEFVDIAGLVRGASKGEGLGNQFLSHIREVDAIIHVLRCFENEDITHVEGGINPLRDAEIIETELMLADLDSLEKRLPNLQKKAKSDKEIAAQIEVIEKIIALLSDGKPARNYKPQDDTGAKILKNLGIITSKPILYVCNVLEDEAAKGNDWTAKIAAKAASENALSLIVSAQIESEFSTLEDEEKQAFLEDLGLSESGLAKIIRAGYSLLGLLTFFTVGPKEARAWTVRAGAMAPEAAGVIHTDFEKGFIRAETIAYDEYIAHNGEQGCKEAGKMRLEGKEYLVKDGDIFHFRFNV